MMMRSPINKSVPFSSATNADRLPSDSLSQIVRDILVDFVYQGFTSRPKPMRAGMLDDVDGLINYIETTPGMNMYEQGRQRANYLRKNR